MSKSAKNVQLAAETASDARWASVVARDPKVDGTFYYSVETTGVYCRPSCAARLARPELVRFHAICKGAEKAGFPAGAMASYTDIARTIGSPNSVRAVAQACGANVLAVAIPCHRVVCNDGTFSGYRWGVERKRTLLEREART